MSIVVKAGAGLAAGVVAGALGLAFLPRLEPNVLRPRNAVEKPQFVGASANAPQPEATLAASTPTPAATPPAPVKSEAAAAPAVATIPSPVVKTPVVAAPPSFTPPAPTPVVVANAAPAPSPVVAAISASPDAAKWSVRGLVALARGDISSARRFLNRAAEAGDARAWVALADTYDPAMLAKLGVVFAPGDAQRARDCLVKAVAAGVVVPKDRIAALDPADPAIH